MTTPLRPEVMSPTSGGGIGWLWLSLGAGLVAASAILFASTLALQPLPLALPEPTTDPSTRISHGELESTLAKPEPAPASAPASANETWLVFGINGDVYAQLAVLEREDQSSAIKDPPRHGPMTMVHDDKVDAALASIEAADVPPAVRDLAGKQVRIDDRCTGIVTGFFVIARASGKADYATDGGSEWTVETLRDHGSVVVAAKIAGCPGGLYARAADQASIALEEITKLTNPRLIAAARAALFASQEARDAQHQWTADGGSGTWHAEATIATQVVRHPSTGLRWIVVHARVEGECGGASANLTGLYRVGTRDELERVSVLDRRDDFDFHAIDRLVDSDGDGVPELVTRDWLGPSRALVVPHGEEIQRMQVPFYGCLC